MLFVFFKLRVLRHPNMAQTFLLLDVIRNEQPVKLTQLNTLYDVNQRLQVDDSNASVAHATWHTFSPSIISYVHLIIILFLFLLHILLSIHLHRSFNSCVSVLPRASLGYINRLN